MGNHPTKILLMGATPYAEVVADMFEYDQSIRIVGFLENLDAAKIGNRAMSRPVLWSGDSKHLAADHRLVCILGTTRRRDWIEEMEATGFLFATLLHSSSVLSSRTEIGAGCVLDAGGVIAGFSRIGDHVRIGRQCSIGHHTEIGAFSTIHPGAIVSGYCSIGEKVTIGTGAVIIDGLKVGDGAYIAAGAVLTKDVPPGALVAGNPSRVVRPDYGPK